MPETKLARHLRLKLKDLALSLRTLVVLPTSAGACLNPTCRWAHYCRYALVGVFTGSYRVKSSLTVLPALASNMRPNGRIQLQDPSTSPSFAHSRTTNPPVSPTLRRNLFSSHLSRRPALPVPNASTDRMPDPFLTQNLTDTAQQQQVHRYEQWQQVQQQQQQQYHQMYAGYPPRLSPSRSTSPVKTQLYSSGGAGIVDINPATGKPNVPIMPRLPSKLPGESDEEDEDEDEEVEEEENDQDDEHAWHRRQARDRAHLGQHDIELHSSSLLGGHASREQKLHKLIDTSGPGTDYRDYEKIESILSEMQSQQRAKAKTAILPESSSSHSFETPGDSGVSARTRGKARATTKQADPRQNISTEGSVRVGGVGASLDPADKNELLSLIMSSLSKRVQEADEDAWMFGDERTGANGMLVSGVLGAGTREDLEY